MSRLNKIREKYSWHSNLSPCNCDGCYLMEEIDCKSSRCEKLEREEELSMRIIESTDTQITSLHEQLSTALSRESAYREALKRINTIASDPAFESDAMDWIREEVQALALDRGSEVEGYEATHDTLEPEEPVGRDEIAKVILDASEKAATRVINISPSEFFAEAILRTYRVERR